MRLQGLFFSYGDRPGPSPEHNLAAAVIERTIMDALGGAAVPSHIRREARRTIRLGDLETSSFYWWLSALYDDPAGVAAAIKKAIVSDRRWEIGSAYRNGFHRVGRAGWKKLTGCRQT